MVLKENKTGVKKEIFGPNTQYHKRVNGGLKKYSDHKKTYRKSDRLSQEVGSQAQFLRFQMIEIK